jgi:transcriptional regulator with XRE-family HTH domain
MRRSPLHTTPPYEVDAALKRLGADLRTARLRRKITLADAAERLGVGRDVIAEAERGKPSTSVVVYAALLWSYGLVERMAALASPATDEEGLRLASLTDPKRARTSQVLDDDF